MPTGCTHTHVRAHTGVLVCCVLGGTWPCVWRSEDNLVCWSWPSMLSRTESLLSACCSCGVSWPTGTVGPWVTSTCTIVPGFYKGSGDSKTGSHTCVTGILTYKTQPIKYLPSPQPHLMRQASTEAGTHWFLSFPPQHWDLRQVGAGIPYQVFMHVQ